MLEQLQQEIENKVNEMGGEIFVALLNSLEALIKADNSLSEEDRSLYFEYIRCLFRYIFLKRILKEREKRNPLDSRNLWNIGRSDYLLAEHNKDTYRKLLILKNLPYKFLHPSGWDNLGFKQKLSIRFVSEKFS